MSHDVEEDLDDIDFEDMTPEQLRAALHAEAEAQEIDTELPTLLSKAKANLPIFQMPPLFISYEQADTIIDTVGEFYKMDLKDPAVAEMCLRVIMCLGEWQMVARGLGMKMGPAQEFWLRRITDILEGRSRHVTDDGV